MNTSAPLNGKRLGEAARLIFGSREEMHETFKEWEAQLVKTIHAACERTRLTPMDDSDPEIGDAVARESGLGSREADSKDQ